MRWIGWLLLGLACTAAGAEQVLVRGVELGQGTLLTRNGQCFALTPYHVVEYAGDIQVATADRTEVPARLETDLGSDVALLRVDARGRLPCPMGWSSGDGLDGRLQQAAAERGPAIVRRVLDTGGVSTLGTVVTGFSRRYLDLAPARPGEEAFQGVSGSTVLLQGRPAAMVLSVDGENGSISALRWDTLGRLVDGYLPSGPRVDIPPTDLPVAAADAVTQVARATAVHAEPDPFAAVVRRLQVGAEVQVLGRVQGRPWWRVVDGFVPVADLVPPR